MLDSRDRPEESLALLKRSLELALEGDVPASAVRAYTNLSNHMLALERWDETSTYREAGGKLAERVGIRGAWWFLQQHAAFWLLAVGHWDELSALAEGLPDPADDPAALFGRDGIGLCAAFMSARRGRLDDARRFAAMFVRSDTDVQSLATAASMDAELSLAAGRSADALAFGRAAFDYRSSLGLRHGAIKDGFRLACEASLTLGDLDALRQLTEAVDPIPPGLLAPSTKAARERMHAHLDASDARLDEADSRFRVAAQIFQGQEMPFERSVVLLERAERLGPEQPGAEQDRSEALRTFEELGAAPWVERAAGAGATGR